MRVKHLFVSIIIIVILLAAHTVTFAQTAPAGMQQKIDSAASYIDEREYNQAAILLEAVIADAGDYKGPETAKAHTLLGVAYFWQEKKDAAYQEFVKALTIDRNLPFVDTRSPELVVLWEKAQAGISTKDTQPPVIETMPIKTSTTVGKPIEIEVQVTDDMGVAKVELYYRTAQPEPEKYKSVEMTEFMKDYYVGKIPGADVALPGIQYYVEATDKSGRDPVFHGSDTNPVNVAVQKVPFDHEKAVEASAWTTFVLAWSGIGAGIGYTVMTAAEQENQEDWNKKANEATILADENDYRNKADKAEFRWKEYQTFSYIGYGVGGGFLIISSALLAVDAQNKKEGKKTSLQKRNWDIIPAVGPDYTGVMTIFRF